MRSLSGFWCDPSNVLLVPGSGMCVACGNFATCRLASLQAILLARLAQGRSLATMPSCDVDLLHFIFEHSRSACLLLAALQP